jgi:hypothetical protein
MAKKLIDKKDTIIRKPPILFKETQSVIQSIQKELKGDFVSYWISSKGSIVNQDAVLFYELIKKRKSKTLYLFIRSDGGNGKASLRMINLFRNYYEEIIALVPLDCASASTMLVMGANKIFMGPLAYLSAIDTSIVHDLSPIDKDNDRVSVSQVELSRVINLWKEQKVTQDVNPYTALYPHIHPLVFGAVDRASLLSIRLTTDILSYHMDDIAKAQQISEHLNSAYPSHGYPINLREAKRLGINVEEMPAPINDLLLTLNSYYSEMAQLALSDYDELNYHDNEILKILEINGLQLFYQKDKDMHYRADERNWVPMNDESSWHRIEKDNDDFKETKFHIN